MYDMPVIHKKESQISLELFQRCTPTAIANGLRFKVQGFKFKGTVEIEYNEGTDLFDVRLIKNGKVVETVEDVYLDSLVDVIDYRVEKVDNYKKRVAVEYRCL